MLGGGLGLGSSRPQTGGWTLGPAEHAIPSDPSLPQPGASWGPSLSPLTHWLGVSRVLLFALVDQ